MNELIRELAEQASTHAKKTVHYYMGQFDGLTWEAKILKVRDLKFAELIVGRCVDWIDGSPTTDAGQLLLSKSFIIANLKGHFGVE